jgi:hypothetical protein
VVAVLVFADGAASTMLVLPEMMLLCGEKKGEKGRREKVGIGVSVQ